MSRITVAPIVEGQGEVESIRTLLWRIWVELLGGEHIEVLRPIRRSRSKFLQEDSIDLANAVNLAAAKLQDVSARRLILILMDAEEECRQNRPLGTLLLGRARAVRDDFDISCVIANIMYETWFVASADSLHEYLDLSDTVVPEAPEAEGCGKGWIKQRFRGYYSETADQPRLTANLDLQVARRRSPSFDKLCRDLQTRMQ